MSNKIIPESMLYVGSILRGIYRIDGYLSSGGFGNTYVATNLEFEEIVTIKEFFIRGITERDDSTCEIHVSNKENIHQFEEQKEKFKKEARRIRKLKNVHIVRVHDMFEENGTAYYVMDYIDGESLAERIKRSGRPFTENEVKTILPQVLDALREVHQNGIWHLDLKPGNVMLDKNGKVYLIDFGASKQIRASGGITTSTALCYTPGYAPNEQIGQMYDRFGPWTDIYALGATIFNLLTGKRPPLSMDIEEEDENAFDFSTDISDEMKGMVLWMMQPKRKARPQSVDEIGFKYDEFKFDEKYPMPNSLYDNEKTIYIASSKETGKSPKSKNGDIVNGIEHLHDNPFKNKPLDPIIKKLIENMVLVEGGMFKTTYQNKLLSSFSIGRFEVSQEEWETVMGSNPSHFEGANLPVESVS